MKLIRQKQSLCAVKGKSGSPVGLVGLALLLIASTSSISQVNAAGVRAKSAVAPLMDVPGQHFLGKPEVVTRFYGAMPTGVAVSKSGRIFVNFPRWGDQVDFTVAEIKSGKPFAYPSKELNQFNPEKIDQELAGEHLVSVQSVVIDPKDRLWLLDTGSIKFGKVIPGAAKLICVDLISNKVIQTIHFPEDVALAQTYLNDVRFDLSRGAAGTAFITDSTNHGTNGIIVVDLASGKSFRRLNDHPSTKFQSGFMPVVEGQPLLIVNEKGERDTLRVGCDGIAISADHKRLFYCPLASRKLYSVSTDKLCDRSVSEAELAKAVCEVVEKGASDGLESDSLGRIYATDYEHNAVHRITLSGVHETLVCDPHVLWPDSLCLAEDGYLYFTANQLHRMPLFNGGKDRREKPYVLFRIKCDAKPVR